MQNLVRRSFFGIRPLSYKAPALTRGFSDPFKDRETSQEKIFFDKEERRALEKLLKKMGEQVKETDIKVSSEGRRQDVADLKTIFDRHRVKYTDHLLDEIYDWKAK